MPKGLFLHPQLQSSSACPSLTEQAELFSTGNLNYRYFFFTVGLFGISYFLITFVPSLLGTLPMKKKQNKTKAKLYLYAAVALIVVALGMVYWYFFSDFTKSGATEYVYIDNDDNQDSVFIKLETVGRHHAVTGFRTLARHTGYAGNIRTGRYAIAPNEGAAVILRHLKNGVQTPVNMTIPEVRTTDRLAAVLGRKLMTDSATVVNMLKDSAFCASLGYDTATIVALFVPNTYSIYWNTSAEALMERMAKEHDRFWQANGREAKAKAMSMTPVEVATLASIIDEETSNNAEKPMIAGMYLNRLNYKSDEYPKGMPLQADPTIKFACGDFTLKRIYHKLLFIDSPYNTYRYPGLPPGPIKVASIAGIDAVLNPVKHDYLFMCAKEDFSGTHNFAKTYEEHLKNAARYTKALNERGIR